MSSQSYSLQIGDNTCNTALVQFDTVDHQVTNDTTEYCKCDIYHDINRNFSQHLPISESALFVVGLGAVRKYAAKLLHEDYSLLKLSACSDPWNHITTHTWSDTNDSFRPTRVYRSECRARLRILRHKTYLTTQLPCNRTLTPCLQPDEEQDNYGQQLS
nr:hypothetical protein CFP56_13482 [Quercus suber]